MLTLTQYYFLWPFRVAICPKIYIILFRSHSSQSLSLFLSLSQSQFSIKISDPVIFSKRNMGLLSRTWDEQQGSTDFQRQSSSLCGVCRSTCSTKWRLCLAGSPCLANGCCIFSSLRALALTWLLRLDFVLQTRNRMEFVACLFLRAWERSIIM